METLKNCRVCGKPVAVSAGACPHCGAKDPSLPRWTRAIIGGSAVFVVVLLSALLFVFVVKSCGLLPD